MIVLSTTDLTLRFGTTSVLEKVSFSVDERDKLGIIGVNGSGKSSLFKLLTGEYEPTEGEVFLSKGKTMGILTQEGAFDENGEDGTGDESALQHMVHAFPALLHAEAELEDMQRALDAGALAIGEAEYDRITRAYSVLHEKFIRDGGLEFRGRCVGILRSLGFDDTLANMPVKFLSGGQKTRLALGIQLSRKPDVLLLDEPTNHLDIDTLNWLERFLADYEGCVMVVSHDRYFLDRVTNKTLCIQNHRAKLYNGGYTKSMEQRRIDREIQEKHYRDQQKEIARQEAYIAQQRAWNRERNIIAAESRQKMLDKMVRVEKPENAPKPIRLKFTASRPSGNDVLDLRDVSMGFDGRMLFEHLNFLVKKDDRLLILGQNGCGKSTLIKLIIGKLEPVSGIIEAGYNVEVGYYDQENQNLSPENTVLDELWNAYPRMTETEIRNTLGQFRFVGEDVYKEVSVLSGGERARLTLAKLILSKMNLLVLDEPTNHLDIDSREALEAALEGFDGTILAVSHDRYFIEKLATRIVEITPGRGATLVEGQSGGDFTDYRIEHKGEAYTEYRRFMEARGQGNTVRPTAMGSAPTATVSDTPTASKEAYQQAKASAAEARKRKNRLEKLQKEAERLEAEIEAIDEELNGSAATDYVRAAELDTRKSECEEALMAVYEELEELEG
ncbi:MAG: ABC-F family ATP-binding cassette domain-containing protein [Ruminococcaceae bacterium]|nr:ABC-F family ATP-binding cassette domain-containing protein [Oscillospiraceae bacterium]